MCGETSTAAREAIPTSAAPVDTERIEVAASSPARPAAMTRAPTPHGRLPSPPGLSSASEIASALEDPHWLRPGPVAASAQLSTTSRSQGPSNSGPTNAGTSTRCRDAVRPRRETPRQTSTTRASSGGANAPSTPAPRAVANAPVAVPSGRESRTTPARTAGSRTSAARAPSRPCATAAPAAPVVAQARAATPRTTREEVSTRAEK